MCPGSALRGESSYTCTGVGLAHGKALFKQEVSMMIANDKLAFALTHGIGRGSKL